MWQKIVFLKEKSNLSKLQKKKLNGKPWNRLNEAEERISGLVDKVEEMYSLNLKKKLNLKKANHKTSTRCRTL